MSIFNIGKAAKNVAQEVVEVGSRTVKKRDLVEFEIEKRLKMGQSQADIQKALQAQGVNIANDEIKTRIAVAKRRSVENKADPRMRKMEANWIIEKGLTTKKDWEDIAAELRDAGFNGDKLVEAAKTKQAKSAYGAYGLGLLGAAGATGTAEGQTRGQGIPALQSDRDRAREAPITDAERKKWAQEDAELQESLKRMKARSDMAAAEAKKRSEEYEALVARMAPIVGAPQSKRVRGVDEDQKALEGKAKLAANPPEAPNPIPVTSE